MSIDAPLRPSTLPHDLVVTAGDPDWHEARLAFNLTLDQRPALVARPRTAAEVAAVVDYARASGLRVAPQRTGHNAGPIESLADTLLLRTDRMQGFEIDARRRVARVAAGVQWGAVSDAADEYALAGLAGSSRTVSIAGYTLGGGVSFLGRKLGLASNAVVAIELVTADGERIRVDHDHEPDLFWALRGGGGSFGVVTALEFALHKVLDLQAGALFFPLQRASEALHAWHDLTLEAPDELTAIGRILRFPDLEFVPEPVRGGEFAIVELIHLGDAARMEEHARRLRALGPVMDTIGPVTPAALGHLHMDPEDPVPYRGEHVLAGALPASAIDELIEVAGVDSGSQVFGVELRHVGGALSRPQPGGGALAALPGEYAMFTGAAVLDPAALPAIDGDLMRVRQVFAPYEAGRYLNFTERAATPNAFFDAATVRRLRAVKAAVDPENVFMANHQIDPETTSRTTR